MSHEVNLAIGALCPVLLLLSVFWYRDASAWIRRLYALLTLVGVTWAALGVMRLYHVMHLTHSRLLMVQRVQTVLAGICLGLLASALLSRDFWQVSRHYRFWYGLTHRSSRPLTGAKISK